jgi:hypothetical protein
MWFSPFSCYLSLFGPNILLSTLFSNTLSLCSSLNVSGQVSHPYTKIGIIMVLYILIFKFLVSNLEDRRFQTKWFPAVPLIPLAPNALIHAVLICLSHSQILELYDISEVLSAVFIL